MVTLNKNYSKMVGTDAPASIDDTNQTQMTEIETDMTTVESAINNHEADTSNPHSVDKSQVGLGNVPNVDATDCDNHTSGTTNKVFSATEQTKLAGIEDGAEVNNVNSVAGKTGTVTLGEADITDLDHDAQKIKSIPVNITDISGGDYLAYDATNTEFKPATPGTPSAHATSHEDGGTDEINVAGLSGELADPQPAKAHASTHQNGGADEIDLTGLSGIPADVDVHNATEKTTPEDNDEIGLIDSAASYVLKKLTFLNLKIAIGKYLMPVGTVKTFNVSTNPATLYGFGTWEAYGTGRVLVGIDTNDTDFDTVDEEGGHKEMQAHKHTLKTGCGGVACGGSIGQRGWSGDDISYVDDTSTVGAGDSGNLQPYKVVYRWVRTA